MPQIPFAARVAAGFAAETLDDVRQLPGTLSGLPVTAVSKALQTAMRAQQHVTALAIRGDEVLAFLSPAEEEPAWATFDEDLDDEAAPVLDPDAPRNGSARPGRFALYTDVPRGTDAEAEPAPAPNDGDPTPPPVPGYGSMTLAQLRARLRSLSLTELESLLDHERGHRNRAPFVAMLGNRIDTVRSQ